MAFEKKNLKHCNPSIDPVFFRFFRIAPMAGAAVIKVTVALVVEVRVYFLSIRHLIE